MGFGGINPATGNPNNLGVRVYRVINQDGSVRQNHYYAIFDFAGGNGDCVVNGINRCDWNDVTLYITNIKPVEPLENWDAEVAAPDALNTATCESEGLVTYGDGTITMQGGSAYQVFDKTWSEIFSCYDACSNSQTLNNLSAGQYIVFIKEENGQNICQQVVTLTNGTGGNLDTDEGNSITNRIASPSSSFTTQSKEQQVAIFPNPANEELFINMSSYAGKQGSLYLFDHLGKVLLEQKMGTLTTDLVKMNIEALQNGLYHLVVEVDQQVVFAKKVIVHQVD